MLDVKFRAWDIKGKDWVAGFNMTNYHGYFNKGLKPGIFRYGTEWEDGEYILEQFTGLVDKNEVMIFEGDIVRHYTDFNVDVHGTYVDYEIVKRNGCWMTSFYKSEKGQSLPRGYTCGLIHEIFVDDLSKEFYFTDHKSYSTIEALEVVGNIHTSEENSNDDSN